MPPSGVASDGRPSPRIAHLMEAARASLFFVPALIVLGAIVLAQGTVAIDRRIGADVLPSYFATTVDSARALLGAIAGGTITAAAVVFSLSLIAVQLAASQFSPRVLRNFLSDRFQQVAIGVVIGTFTYALLVLREVREPADVGPEPFLPQLSIVTAVVLAVAALLAVIASIDHTARSLQVGSIIDGATERTLVILRELPRQTEAPADAADATRAPAPRRPAPLGALPVLAPHDGWVDRIDIGGLTECLAEGTTLSLEVAIGGYVVGGAPMAFAWPTPEDGERLAERVREWVTISSSRTHEQDIGFGLVQLGDVAARALSPAINDPNTAEEVSVRLGAILIELMDRRLPPAVITDRGRTVVRARELDHAGYVDLAVEPLRRHARRDPRVLAAIVRMLAMVRRETLRRRTGADVTGFERQAELLAADLGLLASEADRARVVAALRDEGFASG